MYLERGHRERDIPSLILQNNLRGLEIDPRAAQLASLALAMCAREHDRRFFSRGVRAQVRVLAPVAITERTSCLRARRCASTRSCWRRSRTWTRLAAC